MAVTSSKGTIARRWLELPSGWDTAWKAARSTASTTPAQVAVIGDSNAQGNQSTNWVTKSFPWLLRNSLVAKYGSYGDYYPVSLSARYSTVVTGSAVGVPATVPWTFDTSWGGGAMGGVQANNFGFGTTLVQDTGTFPLAWVNAGSGTFVTPYACTAFDIIYHDHVAGTWKYNVDNAAGTGLVTATTGGWASMRRLSVTGQTNAVHTVRFGGGSVANALALNGIATYNPATSNQGIGFTLNAAGLMRSYDWLNSGWNSPLNRAQQWQGRSKTAISTEQATGFGFPTQPHLAIITLGIVDGTTNVGLTAFRLGLRKLCDALRRGRDGCSIVFVICPNGSSASSDQATQFARAEMWSLYADQIYSLAAEYQCAVANFHADWMSTPVTQGFTTSTDPHPTDLGHQAIADVLSQIIV